MRINEIVTENLEEDLGRRGLLRGALAGAALGAGGASLFHHLKSKTPSEPIAEPPAQDYKSAAFAQKLNRVAQALGVEAKHLWKVMHFETAGTMDPAKTNSIGATGLIQFMPRTAIGLGTTTDDLRQMTATEQLDYVYKYYRSQRLPAGASASDIYLATLFPAALIKKLPDSYVLGREGDNKRIVSNSRVTRAMMYAQNPVFRQKGRRHFTVGDVRRVLDSRPDPTHIY